MANSYTMTKRKSPNLKNKYSRAVVIHGLVDARRTCHIARDLGVEILLVSSPDAVSYIGPTWFFDITLQVKQEFPDVVIDAVLDCGDAAGGALAALRAGIKSIHYSGEKNVAHKIEDIAKQRGAKLLRSTPRAFDPRRSANPDGELRAWLENSTT